MPNLSSVTDHNPSVGSTISSPSITYTCAPQSCVLSPFLFTLHTDDCTSLSPITTYLKYLDDTAVLAILTGNNSVTNSHNSISHLTQWCMDNQLHYNVSKMKELVFNSSNRSVSNPTHNPISISGETVELVESHKYLRLTLDNKLSFKQHTTDIHKCCQKILHHP